MLSPFSHVQLFATLWTVAHQASLSMAFSRQEYWSGLPFPSAGDLPDPGIGLVSLALADVFFRTRATWECKRYDSWYAEDLNTSTPHSDGRAWDGIPASVSCLAMVLWTEPCYKHSKDRDHISIIHQHTLKAKYSAWNILCMFHQYLLNKSITFRWSWDHESPFVLKHPSSCHGSGPPVLTPFFLTLHCRARVAHPVPSRRP